MLAILDLFFGHFTSYVGYFIGYISNVLLLVERTPDTKQTTAPGGLKIEEVAAPGAALPIPPTDRLCGTLLPNICYWGLWWGSVRPVLTVPDPKPEEQTLGDK